MRFWDASAILPLCLSDPRTTAMRKIAEEESAVVAWWGTPVECYSALARLRRDGHLDTSAEDQARDTLNLLAAEWTEIAPSQDVRESAGRLLRLHPLRAADALQLAAALIWASRNPRGHHFVCLDLRLREAARREGFTLLPLEI